MFGQAYKCDKRKPSCRGRSEAHRLADQEASHMRMCRVFFSNGFVLVMQCPCNPNHTYASTRYFNAHLTSSRHKRWMERPHEVLAKRAQRNVPESTKKRVAARAQWRCELCGETLTANYEIDHKLALYLGGTNDMNNLQSCCSECHRTKTRDEYEEYKVAREAYDAYMR